MSTPRHEKEQNLFPPFSPDSEPLHDRYYHRRSSDEDGILQGEVTEEKLDNDHLRITTSYADEQDHIQRESSPISSAEVREQSRRPDDELEMLRVERVVSDAERSAQRDNSIGRSRSMARSRSRTAPDPIDDFDVDTTPIHEKTKVYQPPANPSTNIAKIFKRIHSSSVLVRYFFYITPLMLLLLIPVLFGRLLFTTANVGDVSLFWFGIWLEIVWLTLWLGRIIAKMIPYVVSMISTLFTNNTMEDYEFEDKTYTGPLSGVRTPMAYINKAHKNARHVFNKVGDVAGKVAGDFTGRAVSSSTHPHQDATNVMDEDLRPAFDNDDEAQSAFAMFDKDLNGDISMEELEAVCVEIGRERKAITASLKDLDSVVSKLDSCFLFIVVIVTILVLISLISTSASGVLTSAGSTVLALSWLFTATAQEFLQSEK
ncbi:hypothetical protein B7494_g3781 [Chlorociboria aeruginascens]|nr:hypothetical protein B7494_g3781 [Chlorociboria aeruginascens]